MARRGSSLGGDLLRILAQTGLQFGTQAGLSYLGKEWEAQEKERLLGAKAGLEAAISESDTGRQQELLSKLPENIKGQLPTYTETGAVPVGETPTATNFLTRKDLTYPSETYTPASVERIAVPPLGAKEALSARAARLVPQLSDVQVLQTQFPKDRDQELKELQIRANMGDKAARLELQQQGLEDRKLYQQGLLDLRRDTIAGQQATALQNAGNRQTMLQLMGQRLTDAGEQKDHSLLEKSHEKFLEQMGPLGNEKSRVVAAEQFNSMLKTVQEKHPGLGKMYQPIPIEDYKTGTWLGLREGTPARRVGERTGGAVPTKPTTGPTQAEIDAELKRRGLK